MKGQGVQGIPSAWVKSHLPQGAGGAAVPRPLSATPAVTGTCLATGRGELGTEPQKGLLPRSPSTGMVANGASLGQNLGILG